MEATEMARETANSASAANGAPGLRAVEGIHHVTGITGDVRANVDFYTGVLGLRRVKVTVNYDDPGSLHLYYGDGLGRPGTVVTFFGWEGGRRGVPGTGQVVETAFAVPRGSAGWWVEHLARRGVVGVQRDKRFGAEVVRFADPDGMAVALVEAESLDGGHLWEGGGVPREAAIRGFYGVTLAETGEALPAEVLVGRFGYREAGREGKRVRYEAAGDAGSAGLARVVDVLVLPERMTARMGVGQVHHVAFRVVDDGEQAKWLELLRKDGRNVSPVMDRDYFHSIYFREPGGTLFEMATDGPGFTINETAEALGTKLVLPAWLEGRRAEIEAAVPKIN